MEWKRYWSHVIRHYNVIIEGWPDIVPFKNLSDMTLSLHVLEDLLQHWHEGKTYWREISRDELEILEEQRAEDVETGKLELPPPRKRRSDFGSTRSKKRDTNSIEGHQARRPSKKYKSAHTVDSDDNDHTPETTGSAVHNPASGPGSESPATHIDATGDQTHPTSSPPSES